ncbi:MAG: phosphotransferase, partial [Acidimicrobiales bacterium]|nr:phosphotransferase [Acidimicrobiales bacterium]
MRSDAALINSVVVQGFGRLIRDGRPALRAELAEHATFVVSELPLPWPGWLEVFCRAELEVLEALVAKQHDQVVEQAHLAHGDLDVTHIYQENGCYSGIIDFGEVRGAEREFDLGHFLLHDGETR